MTAASMSSGSARRPEQVSVEVNKEETKLAAADEPEKEGESSGRNRGAEICIMVGIATGIMAVIGVVIAISPF